MGTKGALKLFLLMTIFWYHAGFCVLGLSSSAYMKKSTRSVCEKTKKFYFSTKLLHFLHWDSKVASVHVVHISHRRNFITFCIQLLITFMVFRRHLLLHYATNVSGENVGMLGERAGAEKKYRFPSRSRERFEFFSVRKDANDMFCFRSRSVVNYEVILSGLSEKITFVFQQNLFRV